MTDPATQASGFLNTLGWVLILLSGIGLVLAVTQNLSVWGDVQHLRLEAAALERVRQLLVLPLVFSSLLLLAAVGLLRRWGWARWAVVAFLVVGIALQLLGLVNAFTMSAPALTAEAMAAGDVDMQRQLEAGVASLRMFTTLVAAVCIPLFGWLIYRLLDAEVRRQFG